MDRSGNPFLTGALTAVVGVAIGAGAVVSAELVSQVNPNWAKSQGQEQTVPSRSTRRLHRAAGNDVQQLREAIRSGQEQTDPTSLKEYSEASPPTSNLPLDSAPDEEVVKALMERCSDLFGGTDPSRRRMNRREINCIKDALNGTIYETTDF